MHNQKYCQNGVRREQMSIVKNYLLLTQLYRFIKSLGILIKNTTYFKTTYLTGN